jgi:uncharacterized protein YggE
MKTIIILAFLLISPSVFSQTKNFIDTPYLETSASVDTLITPDRIFLSIIISEADSKDKVSVEELENKMGEKLNLLGIDLKKQLTVNDLASTFEKYLFKQQGVIKSKTYSLEIFDAITAGKVISGLEEIGISNVRLVKTEYSKMEALELDLRSKAVLKAKAKALAMVNPLNQKLGKAIHIHDISMGRITRSSEMKMPMAYEANIDDNSEIPGIDFEKIKVQSNVFIKFEIE